MEQQGVQISGNNNLSGAEYDIHPDIVMDTEDLISSRKRKAVMLTKGETLGSIMLENNNRIVKVLIDAEIGRNNRHAANVALAKRHITLEEQKIRIEEQRLDFEKMRFEGTMSLGQGYIAALANIGDGLMKIGNAMEDARKL